MATKNREEKRDLERPISNVKWGSQNPPFDIYGAIKNRLASMIEREQNPTQLDYLNGAYDYLCKNPPLAEVARILAKAIYGP